MLLINHKKRYKLSLGFTYVKPDILYYDYEGNNKNNNNKTLFSNGKYNGSVYIDVG